MRCCCWQTFGSRHLKKLIVGLFRPRKDSFWRLDPRDTCSADSISLWPDSGTLASCCGSFSKLVLFALRVPLV